MSLQKSCTKMPVLCGSFGPGTKGGDRFFGGLIGYTDIFPSQYRYKRYLVLPISVQSISSDTNIDNVVRYRYQYQYR